MIPWYQFYELAGFSIKTIVWRIVIKSLEEDVIVFHLSQETTFRLATLQSSFCILASLLFLKEKVDVSYCFANKK